MTGEVDIRSLSVTAASKLLCLPAEAIRGHIARGLPLRKDKRIDMIVYAAWLNTVYGQPKSSYPSIAGGVRGTESDG